MRTTPDQRMRQYRIIYEILVGTPRVFITEISSVLGIDRGTASKRIKYAFDDGFILKPQIRRQSYSNFKENVFLLKCEHPSKTFNEYIKNKDISYHAKLLGSADLLVMSNTEIDSECSIVEGVRSDYHVSFVPDHSWEKAIDIMHKKIEAFESGDYCTNHILETHLNQTIPWDTEDEKLFKAFKYDLRKAFTPIRKETLISSGKIYEWLGNLKNSCTVFTSYYPKSISSYDPYLWIFETDYEDFIINLFSTLPTTASFLKVGEKLIIFTHIERQFVRVFDFCLPKELEILLIVEDLTERGILKSEEHAIIESFWRKEI